MFGKKSQDRSVKAQEKLADQFMSMSTNIFTATMVGILILPLNEMIKLAMDVNSNTTKNNFIKFAEKLYTHQDIVLLFLFVYFAALLWALFNREIALNIYDRLEKKSENKRKNYIRNLR